jgi:hypothetical protein
MGFEAKTKREMKRGKKKYLGLSRKHGRKEIKGTQKGI